MAEDTVPSFEEFAGAKGLKPRGACGVCTLPPEVLSQVHWALEHDFRWRAIQEYLRPLGHSITQNQLTHHMTGGHADV